LPHENEWIAEKQEVKVKRLKAAWDEDDMKKVMKIEV
jgi:hypothetical protein